MTRRLEDMVAQVTKRDSSLETFRATEQGQSQQIQTLKSQNSELGAKIDSYLIEKSNLEDNLHKFESDLSSFKADFDEQLCANQKLTASLESSKSQAATYFTGLNSKSLELAELRIQLDASNAAGNEARARICDLASQSDSNAHTIMQLQSINDELSTQLEDVTRELSSITRNCEIFNENLTSKIIDCESLETHNSNLQTQLEKFENMNCDLRSNFESILHSSLQSNKDLDKLKQALADAQKENIQSSNTITNHRISYSALTSTHSDLESAHQTILTQKVLLETNCESLTISLSDLKSKQISMASIIETLKGEIITSKTIEIQILNKNKKIFGDYETLSSDYQKMVEFCTEKEGHLGEARGKLDVALDQVCLLNRVNQGLEVKVEGLEGEVREMRDRGREVEDRGREVVGRWEEEVGVMRGVERGLEGQVAGLTGELERGREEACEMERKICEMGEEVRGVEAEGRAEVDRC